MNIIIPPAPPRMPRYPSIGFVGVPTDEFYIKPFPYISEEPNTNPRMKQYFWNIPEHFSMRSRLGKKKFYEISRIVSPNFWSPSRFLNPARFCDICKGYMWSGCTGGFRCCREPLRCRYLSISWHHTICISHKYWVWLRNVRSLWLGDHIVLLIVLRQDYWLELAVLGTNSKTWL